VANPTTRATGAVLKAAALRTTPHFKTALLTVIARPGPTAINAAVQHYSHNTQYVNKSLIYIIKMTMIVIPPERERGQEAVRVVITAAAQG
jgi:hypothetical protein